MRGRFAFGGGPDAVRQVGVVPVSLPGHMKRRDFLRAGLAGAALAGGRLGLRGRRGPSVSLVADPADPAAGAAAATWALDLLRRRLADAGVPVRTVERVAQAGEDDLCVVAGGRGSPEVAAALARAGVAAPDAPEGLALIGTRLAGRPAVLACGADGAGLAHALAEIADRVAADIPIAALAGAAPAVERPANAVRSVMRQFTSETLDKPWFYDREMWPRYFDLLATHRFNRFHLAFGLGYDSLQRVADAYFLFAYPFLVAVPGYDVRVTGLPDAERERNLATLRFIGERAAACGLGFELGLWMHGYRLGAGSTARHVVEGLDPDTHAAYCRDALTAVLRACPTVTAVGLRIHGESGIAEGSYDFWAAVFAGAAAAGRRVEIDLHAKGIDGTMIERALATGMPVNVSPKFAAEHLGMPYHQAAIRDLEMPVAGRTGTGLMRLSEGARVFTRYGYADLLREDRRYTVRPRVFSGTQRLLAWGDPAWAAAYARAFGFCGMAGADLMEPLTCRGRRGTGTGSRLGYADGRLATRWDWEKYAAWYRAWGRMLYDPATGADVFRRDLGGDAAARSLASALAGASRILPVVTTAHLPSAACDAYWPEIYWSQGMLAEPADSPYFDTPEPRTFPHASPLDPELFATASGCAAELLAAERGAKYSPVEVAVWLEDLAAGAARDLARSGAPVAPARLRIAIDVAILAGLGRFFGAKLRSGVLVAIHERTGDRRALEQALLLYRRAREEWAVLAERARGVYQADLSASDRADERGQWTDRLPVIDRDIGLMEARLATTAASDDPRVVAAVEAALGRPRRTPVAFDHEPPPTFRPAEPLDLALRVRGDDWTAARLHYRHVNQAERWVVAPLASGGGAFRGSIPAAYTDAPYPLQYYFDVAGAPAGQGGPAALLPGFAPDLGNVPYYVVRRG